MRKTVFDKSALTFIGVVCLIAALVSGFKVYRVNNVSCPNIKILVSTGNITENTPFTVSFVSPGVSSWDWNFGDGTPHGNVAKVNHVYTTAGKYNLTLMVNGSEKCTNTLPVIVALDKSGTSTGSGEGVEYSIEGPSTAVIGRPAKFSETSGKGTSWQWTSSESNGIDGTGQEMTYTFATAGKRTIYVNVNGGKGKASIDVNVVASSGGGGGSSKPKMTDAEFKDMLGLVVGHRKDVADFKQAMGGNTKLMITVIEKGKGKLVAFDEYCKQIKKGILRKGVTIDQVKLTYSKEGNIASVAVQQHY